MKPKMLANQHWELVLGVPRTRPSSLTRIASDVGWEFPQQLNPRGSSFDELLELTSTLFLGYSSYELSDRCTAGQVRIGHDLL